MSGVISTRPSRIRSTKIPRVKTVYLQSFNILCKTIKRRINMASVSKYQDFIVDYPSISAHHHLIKLIKFARDDKYPSTFTEGTFELFYLITDEISEIYPLNKILHFRNINGQKMTLHEAHHEYLCNVMKDNVNINIFEALQKFRIFCLEYREDLVQKKIKQQLKWINRHLANKTIPPKYATISTYDEMVPSYCYFLNEMMLGTDEHSKDHWEAGRVKIKFNCAIYDIINDEIDGECNLLESSLPAVTEEDITTKTNIIATELSSHRFFVASSETRVLSQNKPSKALLRKKKARTKVLKTRLKGLKNNNKKKYKPSKELININRNKRRGRRRRW
eukprot:70790_1